MMDSQMVRNLVSLGYMAKENNLEMEDVVEMVEKGFVAINAEKQVMLA